MAHMAREILVESPAREKTEPNCAPGPPFADKRTNLKRVQNQQERILRTDTGLEPSANERKFYALNVGNVLVIDDETGERSELIKITTN
jgi:hypothetical protein